MDNEEKTIEQVELNLQKVGVPCIDEMLRGGIPIGSTILVAGPSGAGKTMFCMQWLFEGYRQFEEQGLYISLTEPINKFQKNLKSTSFYEQEYIDNKNIVFQDLRTYLENEDLDRKDLTREDIWKIIDAIGNMVMESGAKRVILDSITAICYRLEQRDLIRHFIFSLGTTLAYLDATVFLTSEIASEGYSIFGVEEFICDGIFSLRYTQTDFHTREFRIVKLRGHGYNNYPAKFRITGHGLVMFPYVQHDLTFESSSNRISTGIEGLDEMTHGGYIEGSSTLISGPSGSGKSIAGWHCIMQGLKDGKKCMMASFEESRSELIRNAGGFGWDLAQNEEEGNLVIAAHMPDEKYLEEHIQELEELVRENDVKIMVLDSISALSSYYPSSTVYNMCKRLMNHNKKHGVTSLFTVASSSLIGAENNGDLELSTLTDSIIMLRYVEIDSQLRHGVMILKMRSSEHDRSMREFDFGSNGIVIQSSFAGYEGIMSGSARKVSGSEKEKLQSLFLEMLGTEGDAMFQEMEATGITLERVQSLIDQLIETGAINEQQKADYTERAEKILQ